MSELVTYRTDAGIKTAIALKPGRKWLPVIVIDSPMRVRKVPLSERRFMTPLADYPLRRAVRKYLAAGRRLGITKRARKALREVL